VLKFGKLASKFSNLSAILGLGKNKGLTGTNKLLTPLDSLKPRIAGNLSILGKSSLSNT
jgi:hypothetical protein